MLLALASAVQAQVQITLDPAIQYQTIRGWEATCQAAQGDIPERFANYKDELFDYTVDDLGITSMRVEIRSGDENDTDYFTPYLNDPVNNFQAWRDNWYLPKNDNASPTSANLSGFQFAGLDHAIDKVILPIRQRLIDQGQSLYVNLCYVDMAPASSFEHYTNPAEYAEYMSVIFAHMQSKYGFVPNAIEICLEPENCGGWDNQPTRFANVIVATGDRLAAEGYHPDIIAPSVTRMTHCESYINSIINANSGVMTYLTDICYHRYRDTAAQITAALPSLATFAGTKGLRTAMLEHMDSGYIQLHEDLTVGNCSSWQQYSLAWYGNSTGQGSYFISLNSDPNHVVWNPSTKFLSQYFKYIRPGAVRIKGTTSNASHSPAAFINEDGGYVVVVKATSSGSFGIAGLPAGDYGIVYTTSSQFAHSLGTVSLNQGQTLSTSIPAAGAITVYAIVATTPPVKCFVFYNNSKFDGSNPAANAADDAAIATDKVALRPGQTATFANYTSYDKGINGIMIDLPAMPGTPTLADFTFKKGNTNTPSSWSTASANTITVRPGAGSLEGYDRIEITRPDGALTKMWLQITVKATAATGLAQDEVFYFGNAIGETGNSLASTRVDAIDSSAVRADTHKTALNPAPITNACDINRDGKANTADEILIRQHTTTILTDLKLISVP